MMSPELRNSDGACKKWTTPILNWRETLNRVAITYEDRLPDFLRNRSQEL
jgi:hypothetical protein